jgi:TM2 domain-containing membrane protein YozV
MKYLFNIVFFLVIVFFSNPAFSQTDSIKNTNSDTLIYKGGKDVIVSTVNKKNPKRAALFSAIIPGAGQVYNGKYWKVPIVYSAIGAAAFFFDYNNKQYHTYLTGYQQRLDSVENQIFDSNIATDVILEYKNKTRRNRDLSVVILLAVYGLNIIDATVDAELSDFDVSDDLSRKISPEVIPLYGRAKKNTIGLSFCFNFK